MKTSQTLSFDTTQAEGPASPDGARLFYAGAAALLLFLMFLGFQQFYLHGRAFPGRELTPPIRTILILHGSSMSAWMLLFLIQPLLIVSGNRHIHMLLGRVGAVLAACVVFFGLQVGIEAARVNPPDMTLWGLVPSQFLAIPIFSVILFAVFVSAGVWNRRRPEVHRPLMLLGTLAAMPAAVDRIETITSLYRDTLAGLVCGPFFGTLTIGLLFFVLNRLLTRSWDRVYAMGYAGLIVASLLIMQLATTDVWAGFTSFLLG